MDTPNTIPKARAKVVTLASVALGAAERLGPTVDLRHNTAAALAADLRAVIGSSESESGPLIPGADADFSASAEHDAAARAQWRETRGEARQFAVSALLLLRSRFGSRLNARWRAAGIALKSLIVPYDPAEVLLELRAYFRAHPEHESAEQNLTAARADEWVALLQTRRHAMSEGRVQQHGARTLRNTALATLRRRLSHLRAELAQLLSPEDPRWCEFGFRRPAEARPPEAVAEVTVTPGLPEEAQVTWPAAARAERYRVRWWRNDAPDEIHDAGLTPLLELRLSTIPNGVPMTVSVSALNKAGASPRREQVFWGESRG